MKCSTPDPLIISPHRALFSLLSELGRAVCSGVAAVALDGTSSTALLVDEAAAAALAAGGAHLAPPKLYNEAQASSTHPLLRHGCAAASELDTGRLCALTHIMCSLLGYVWHSVMRTDFKHRHPSPDLARGGCAAPPGKGGGGARDGDGAAATHGGCGILHTVQAAGVGRRRRLAAGANPLVAFLSHVLPVA